MAAQTPLAGPGWGKRGDGRSVALAAECPWRSSKWCGLRLEGHASEASFPPDARRAIGGMMGRKRARIETASVLQAARGRLMAGPSVVGGDDGPRRGISHMRALLYSARGRCTHLVEEERTKAARIRRGEQDVGGAATGRPSRPGARRGRAPTACETMNARERERERETRSSTTSPGASRARRWTRRPRPSGPTARRERLEQAPLLREGRGRRSRSLMPPSPQERRARCERDVAFGGDALDPKLLGPRRAFSRVPV